MPARLSAPFTLFALLLSLTGCGGSQTASIPTEPVVQYLKGELVTTSPDGKRAFGPPVTVLAMRTVDPASGTITEQTRHGVEARTTTLQRQGETNTFEATDKAGSFKGTIAFGGADWAMGAATYQISMSDGSGTITGQGTWADKTYVTEKVFSDPKGTPRAKMVERLTLVSKAEYDQAMAQ
ncbi:MAG: hypothetical protein ACE366_28415 [Bradymonadia bacterium]